MVFAVDQYVERARGLLALSDLTGLRYACLELRYALELIAHKKLELRLGKISAREIAAWTPRRVIERLMDLVDKDVARDIQLSIAREDVQGNPATDFMLVGATKGIDPKQIGAHWQRLGSYLHVRMPKKKGEPPTQPSETDLRAYLDDVITYVASATSTKFDAHLSHSVTFQCGKCKQFIVRNAELLKEGDVVWCQNESCNASYIAHKAGDNFSIERYRLHFDCSVCKTRNYVEANDLLKLKRDYRQRLPCSKCGRVYHAGWVLRLYDPANDNGAADHLGAPASVDVDELAGVMRLFE